jgi:SH3-like domain-containing protein
MIISFSPQARRAICASPLLLLLLLALLALPQGSVSATEGERTYRVVGVDEDDVLNIRAGPSAGYEIIGEIPPTGRGVRLTGPCRGWCPVAYRGAAGWVSARYLAIEPGVAPFAQQGPDEATPVTPQRLAGLPAYWRVTGVADDGLKVHEEPSPQAPVVHVFTAQASCIKLAGGCRKPWCQVAFPTGGGEKVGWVDSKNLAPSDRSCNR